MKAFIIAVSILISIFAFTIFNSIYINNVTDSLIEDAKKLEINEESISEFAKKWNEVDFYVRISSSHKETHRIDEVLSTLQEKACNNIASGFYEERALLIEYLSQIQEDETVSIDSII